MFDSKQRSIVSSCHEVDRLGGAFLFIWALVAELKNALAVAHRRKREYHDLSIRHRLAIMQRGMGCRAASGGCTSRTALRPGHPLRRRFPPWNRVRRSVDKG
jgi:hypothetical protein